MELNKELTHHHPGSYPLATCARPLRINVTENNDVYRFLFLIFLLTNPAYGLLIETVIGLSLIFFFFFSHRNTGKLVVTAIWLLQQKDWDFVV